MARGRKSVIGDTNVAKNGYHYIRTDTGWRLTHHVIAEEKLGREIKYGETVRFVDGNRDNLTPENVTVVPVRSSLRGRIAKIEAQIMELEGERDRLKAKLAMQNGQIK
jgi:hypothetical protein